LRYRTVQVEEESPQRKEDATKTSLRSHQRLAIKQGQKFVLPDAEDARGADISADLSSRSTTPSNRSQLEVNAPQHSPTDRHQTLAVSPPYPQSLLPPALHPRMSRDTPGDYRVALVRRFSRCAKANYGRLIDNRSDANCLTLIGRCTSYDV